MRKTYTVIVADPPWSFKDKLTMSKVKRGADANYETLSIIDLAELPVDKWASPDALLALWVPSSLLGQGLDLMATWGFEQKQILTWVKTTKGEGVVELPTEDTKLAFGMGRYFRGCTEHALIGTCGKMTQLIKSKSERNVILHPAMPHSQKPELLQDALERMVPKGNKLELFARRDRKGWTCVGDECPSTEGMDIRDWKPAKLKVSA